MLEDLKGGVAVITGAGSGIGAGLARTVADAGMTVIVSDISGEKVDRVANDISLAGGIAHADVTDVSDAEQVHQLAERVHRQFGNLRLLVNNAGVTAFGAGWELTSEQWRNALGTNLFGVIHGVTAFMPRMVEAAKAGLRAAVVNMSSTAALATFPMSSPYVVSKHGLLALSECLRQEVAMQNLPIDVSVVLPGLVDTPIYDASIVGDRGVGSGDAMRQMFKKVSEHEGMRPDEAARIIFDGILARSFWISTHPEVTRDLLKQRGDFLRNQAEPTVPEFVANALSDQG